VKLLTAGLALSFVMHSADLSKQIALLDHERDGGRLEAAAMTIANSGEASAIEQLGVRFATGSFLNRLDNPGETERLGRVFGALAAHPSQAAENVCTRLAFDAQFTSLPLRLNYLLTALAAVRPMSQGAARVFQQTSRNGYLEVNGPLLAANGSPRALEVLEGLLADRSLDEAQLVSMAHWSLVPVRTSPDIVAMSARVLNPDAAAPTVATAVAESLYDYRPGPWFGPRRNLPRPIPWAQASLQAKDLLRQLGTGLLKRDHLDPSLRAAVERTLADLAP
jgi:hypothetical protein